ncbi:hypothetical protein K431DRAFT_156576 [Polychaeton citri CBS 116435]|uniref:Exonuclease V n=1 Tax=Polychaeton citri CBS 116435 TaxID=1314669 RepID=A0A9P4UQB4_9PEZI|nr:hypothetical protein K431DRAFT_156576 [Polychaeton citri CBS 116435]
MSLLSGERLRAFQSCTSRSSRDLLMRTRAHWTPKSPKIQAGSLQLRWSTTSRIDTLSPRFTAQSNGEEVRLYNKGLLFVPAEDGHDSRSPLERFRKPPRKPLSVTDLVSPAWCELQYWYSLTKYGRVRRTAAMKEGSKVHKTLEEQIHAEVPIEIITREDAFGLKIWNVIQGLRTLRATGMTRELEIWGLVEEVRGQLQQPQSQGHPVEHKNSDFVDAGQKTLAEYFKSSQGGTPLESGGLEWLGSLQNKQKTFYIIDIKTRQSRSLPSKPSQLRPTAMQLMLYHSLFAKLASDSVEANMIFDRYDLEAKQVFSDTFIAQISSFDSNFSTDANDDDDFAHLELPQDTISEIVEHNTLTKLWSLLTMEFQKTIPNPATSISPMLTAEFRSPGSGRLIGKRLFPFESAQLDLYTKNEMQWWRGEREAKGVDVEEAFKCRICEFAEDCTWRTEKVEKAISESRRKAELKGSRKRSAV